MVSAAFFTRVGQNWARLSCQTLYSWWIMLLRPGFSRAYQRWIHHGGSGTTGLALRSGVSSMVIPFTADQFFWGARTHALDVGGAPIPFSRMTAENLAQAIQVMAQSTDVQRQAVHLRDAMAIENGVQQAVEVIQRCLM